MVQAEAGCVTQATGTSRHGRSSLTSRRERGIMSSEEIRRELVDRIRAVERPAKILLFGSHAQGTARPDSDIDLLVVLDSDQLPQTFREKAENYLRISRILRELEKRVPIDLLVYTRPEFERFIAAESAFSKKILREGVELS